MIDVLQDLVDTLSSRLQRSVAVDDVGIRLLAASAHFEDVDPARLGSLVGRRVSGAVREYVMCAGVQNWREPTTLPANPDLGLDSARLCIPLRSRYELLGFLWLIDDGSLTDDDLATTREWADLIEDLLARRVQSAVDSDVETEAIVLALVSDDASARRQAADDLRDLGVFQRAVAYTATVLKIPRDREGLSEAAVRAAASRGVAQGTRSHPRDQVAHASDGNRSILVVGHRALPTNAQLATAATSVHAAIKRCDSEIAAITSIGVGQPVSDLVRIHEAVDQATNAADVALRTGSAVTVWSDEELDGLLCSWLRPELEAHLVPPIIRRLAEQPDELIQIVSAFLDAGGNVAPIADRLHLHRTTVYYRLNRLRECTGIDLNDGTTRLLIHLWLRGRRYSAISTAVDDDGPMPRTDPGSGRDHRTCDI